MEEKKIRNKMIRRGYKLGQGGAIGRGLGISRQRIHQIVHQKKLSKWGRLWNLIRKHLT